ncbi:MAG: family 10 glycosylhydrolase [Verrucomicrobiales bacterium]|nr:family 10 glycosylhydrolase [Verrucomicrobiales bacterium]
MKKLILLSLILFTSLPFARGVEAANTQVIDALQYADDAAAQAFWKPMHEGEPGALVKKIDGGQVIEMVAPFASQSDKPRFTIDRDIKLDLSKMTSFTLGIKAAEDEVDVRFTLYFHSDKGWYGAGAYLQKSGWRKLTFMRKEFSEEGEPAGWAKIDKIRISVWPGAEGQRDISFHLKDLQAHWNHVAIILPDEKDKAYGGAEGIANRMVNMLNNTGVGVDVLSSDFHQSVVLGDRPLVILPHNPRMSDEALLALERYVEKGGKLFLCYSLPGRLGKLLGFEKGDYIVDKEVGGLAAIQFENQGIPGLPERVIQDSWNIYTAKPAGFNARVIGRWLNIEGQPTGKAAMLLSDRGAYFSHILLADDPENKKAMLTALLGKLSPSFWLEAAQNAHKGTVKIGHCNSEKELDEWVGDGAGAGKLAESEKIMRESAKLLEGGESFEAYQSALLARELKETAYLMAQPSRQEEARAFWNHTGTGAYPGDWDRTLREMAEGGMNMILPNMLWGAQAHYPSDVLPRSKTFEKYGDQIEQCVAAAKKHGVEVHVWKVNFNLGYGVPQEYIDQLRKDERLQVSVDGEPGDWLNPAHPKNFQMELDSILEVIRKYDIDGFHFDYIRYSDSKHDYSDYSRRKFEADTGLKVKNWPGDCFDGALVEAYTDWRCDNITRLVKAVSEQARKIRPGIKISAAVFREYPSCRRWVAQDWPLWAKEGYVDFLCPMDYTDDDEKYIDWITAQKELLPEGFPLYPGIGMSLRGKTQSADRVMGQVFLNRKVGTDGYTIFELNKDTLQIVTEAMSLGAGKSKAVPPHQAKKP